MWTLRQSPARAGEDPRRVPASWGLAKDEFIDNGNWPRQIYVREARRMVSDYVMTETELPAHARSSTDSVGMGAYNMDSHNIQRYVTTGRLRAQRGRRAGRHRRPYPISYRASCRRRASARTCSCPSA